jgi:hypothetical protein
LRKIITAEINLLKPKKGERWKDSRRVEEKRQIKGGKEVRDTLLRGEKERHFARRLPLNYTRVAFKDSARTAKKTQLFTITKINWLTLFKKMIAYYIENHMEPINTFCRQKTELQAVNVGFIHR